MRPRSSLATEMVPDAIAGIANVKGMRAGIVGRFINGTFSAPVGQIRNRCMKEGKKINWPRVFCCTC